MAKPQSVPQTLQDILDRPSSEVERPKPLPTGSYVAIVRGLPRHDVSSRKQTPFVEFTLEIQSAGEDVDEDDLKEWMSRSDGTTRTLQTYITRVTFYKTEDALWRLVDFLDNCGAGEDSETISQRIDGSPNCSVLIYIRHRASEDGQTVFAEIGKTAPVED